MQEIERKGQLDSMTTEGGFSCSAVQLACKKCTYTNISNFQDTIRYEIVGNERALEFYYLDPSSGLITVKKLITEGEQTDDTVSHLSKPVVRKQGRQLPFAVVTTRYFKREPFGFISWEFLVSIW